MKRAIIIGATSGLGREIAMNLVREDSYAEQLDFFDTTCEAERVRKQKREMTVDEIREKFGRGAIVRGSVINNDIGINGGGKK